MTICLKTNSFALKGFIEIKKGSAFERTSLTFDYGIKTYSKHKGEENSNQRKKVASRIDVQTCLVTFEYTKKGIDISFSEDLDKSMQKIKKR